MFFLSRNSFFIEQNLSGKTKRVLLEQQQQEEKSVSIFHMTIARIWLQIWITFATYYICLLNASSVVKYPKVVFIDFTELYVEILF